MENNNTGINDFVYTNNTVFDFINHLFSNVSTSFSFEQSFEKVKLNYNFKNKSSNEK